MGIMIYFESERENHRFIRCIKYHVPGIPRKAKMGLLYLYFAAYSPPRANSRKRFPINYQLCSAKEEFQSDAIWVISYGG